MGATSTAYFSIGLFAAPIVLVCFCFWRIDFDSPSQVNEEVLERVRTNPKLVEFPLQAEYARSWLEGRFMGEDWMRAREAKLFAIGDVVRDVVPQLVDGGS